jgi:prolyl 4-hydroxylase
MMAFLLSLILTTFLSSYEVEVLSESPRILVLHDFLSDLECNHIRKLAKPELLRSTVASEDGKGQVHTARTSQGMWFPSDINDPILANIERRISEFTGIPEENGENIQVLRYKVGGEYKPHHDYFDPKVPGSEHYLVPGGQRVASFLMYLNTPEEGGETIFPLLKINVIPEKGKALLFYDCTPDGEIDPRTFHGGAPVKKGHKWLATRWLRQGPFR